MQPSVAWSANPLAIQESELAAAVGPLDVSEQTATVFLNPDPLGAEGISLENARATLAGAGLRLSQVGTADQKYFLDFILNPNRQFGLAQIGSEPSTPFQGLAVTGLDTTRTLALVSGPPLRVLATPVLVNGSPVTISLALNAQASFDIEAVTSLSAEALAFLSSQAPATRSSARASASSAALDGYIAMQTRLDRSLPSGTDWNNAVLKCITNGIDALKVDGFSAKMLQMVGSSAPRIAQDVRFHLALGRPADASLVMSEWAFKALAEGASSGNEFGDLFKLISKNSSYGRALAAGAGACTVDYKEGLKVMLTGMANKLFPYGSCFAGLSMQAGLQARNWLNNEVVETIYQGWRNHGDDVFTYGSLKGIDGLIGYVASQMPPGKNPYHVEDADRAVATELLKKTFREWQAAETSSSTINDHLTRMKTRFQSDRFRQLIGEDVLRRSLARASEASEADVFARYVEMMQRTRARLSPFAQTGMTDDQIDDAVELALAEYLNRGPAAWNTAIARQLQLWDPDKFASEPPVCSTAGNPDIVSISLKYELSASPFDATCYSDASFLKPSYSFVLNRTTSEQNGGNIAQAGNGQFSATCTTSRCNPSITCSGSTQTTAGTPTATLACTTKHGTLPINFTLSGPVNVSTAPITHVTGTYTVPVNGASGPNAKPVPCVAPLTVLGTVSFRSQ